MRSISFKFLILISFVALIFLIFLRPLSTIQCDYLRDGYDNFTDDKICVQNWFKEDDKTILLPMTMEMRNIVHNQRESILKEMQYYKYSSKISQKSLRDLIPEYGGKPVLSIVVTTWRSGSTFIGGVLDSHPATYHFSEPLAQFKTVQIRDEPRATQALTVLKYLLNCNFKTLDKYLEISKTKQIRLFAHNTRLWNSCKENQTLCFLPNFLTPMCKVFPFISMKTVHIRLRLMERLMMDPELKNIKIVYLVRDPRGTLRSRNIQPWCRKNIDCGDATRLCADLIDDYAAALRFKQLYPSRFRVIRYEDMSLNPSDVLSEMFDFFGLYYSEQVQKFVKEHTTKNDSHAFEIYRDSSHVALTWREKMDFATVKTIQQKCSIALAAWGYLPAANESDLKTFNPLRQPFDLPPS